MIRITEVRIHLLDRQDSNLKAYANVTFDDCFVIHGVKVLSGERGLFVGMPRRRGKDGKAQDIAHPVNNETRELIQKTVLEAYEEAMESAKHSEPAPPPSPPSSPPPAPPGNENTEFPEATDSNHGEP